MPIFFLDKRLVFPNPELAGAEGMLAIGGDLSAERLVLAYQMGIFPWFSEGEHIAWYCPDPRFVLFPEELKVSKSMRPYFNQKKFEVTFDVAFEQVMRGCAGPRPDEFGTWISEEMVNAYSRLHHLGIAHSVEVWQAGELVGGLYGIALGKVFFGESMFAKVSNASKFGFITLVQWLQERGFWLVDCQQQTTHLGSLGARAIPRRAFLAVLKKNEEEGLPAEKWETTPIFCGKLHST